MFSKFHLIIQNSHTHRGSRNYCNHLVLMDNKYTPNKKKTKKNLCYFPTLLHTFSSYPSCKLFFSTSYYSLRDFLLSTNSPQLLSPLRSRLELQSCTQSKPIPSPGPRSSSNSSLSSNHALSSSPATSPNPSPIPDPDAAPAPVSAQIPP